MGLHAGLGYWCVGLCTTELRADRLQGITGSKMEKACDLSHITLNKNAVVGDVSAMTPGGVRIGAPAMTSRGCHSLMLDHLGSGRNLMLPALACTLWKACPMMHAAHHLCTSHTKVGF